MTSSIKINLILIIIKILCTTSHKDCEKSCCVQQTENQFTENDLNRNTTDPNNKLQILNQLTAQIIDTRYIANTEEIFERYYKCLESNLGSSETQFLTVNLLIIRFLADQKMPFYKLKTKNNLIILFQDLSIHQRIYYLPDLLKIFDINCKFIPEENTLLILRHEKCLYDCSLDFKTEDRSRFNLVIPHHVLLILQSIDRNKYDINKYCIETFKEFINMTEVINVHLHGDKVITNFNYFNLSLDFFMNICAPENVHTFEVAYPYIANEHDGMELAKNSEFQLEINITSLNNLKKLKVGSVTRQEDRLCLLCSEKIYSNLKMLSVSHTHIDKNMMSWLRSIKNLENLVLEEHCVLSYESIQELNSLPNIKNKIYKEVVCKNYRANTILIPSLTFSMENNLFSMISIESKEIDPNYILFFLENKDLFLEVTAISVVAENSFGELILECLNFRKLISLEICIYYYPWTKSFTFPSQCACANTLKTLKLCLDVEYDSGFVFDISNIECLSQVTTFALKIATYSTINCIGFIRNSVFLENLQNLQLNMDNKGIRDLFINLDTQTFQLKSLKICGDPFDYEFCQKLLNKLCLRNSLEALEFFDFNGTKTIIIDLKNYHKLNKLIIGSRKEVTQNIIKHLLNDKIIYTLQTLKFTQNVFFTQIFFDLMTELKELHLKLNTTISEFFHFLGEDKNENIFYNRIEVLKIEYDEDCDVEIDILDEIMGIEKIFQNLKCLSFANEICLAEIVKLLICMELYWYCGTPHFNYTQERESGEFPQDGNNGKMKNKRCDVIIPNEEYTFDL